MTYKEIVEKVSKELGLPRSLVDKTYKAYWGCIRATIKALPLKKGLTEEEFRSMKTSFNISRLGKLAVIWKQYAGYQKSFYKQKRLKEEDDKT